MDETCFLFPSLAVASLYGSLCTAQTGLLSLRLELLPLAAQRTAAEGPARPLCQSLQGGGQRHRLCRRYELPLLLDGHQPNLPQCHLLWGIDLIAETRIFLKPLIA